MVLLKKSLLWIPLVIILAVILFVKPCNRSEPTASGISISEDSISEETIDLRDSLSASIDALDSIRPLINSIKAELVKYEQLKEDYQDQEAIVIRETKVDSSAIIALRSKLAAANNEIYRLNGQLAAIQSKPNVPPVKDAIVYVQPAIETPDENSIVITLDGSSRKGEIFIPNNLSIYLISYSEKPPKKLMNYDSSCDQRITSNPVAKYYKGIYFFNSVTPGKYLIKICTYLGNYKLIEKPSGKYSITMQVSPPIQ